MNYKYKNGWSMSEMIGLMAVLFFFFLVAIILIIAFYHSIDKEVKTKEGVNEMTYSETEEALESAAMRYMQNKYENVENVSTTVLTKKQLVKMGYIIRPIHIKCNGYAIASISDGIVDAKGYIDCGDYETQGYESWRLDE